MNELLGDNDWLGIINDESEESFHFPHHRMSEETNKRKNGRGHSGGSSKRQKKDKKHVTRITWMLS
jgi:hypothetical protein